MMKAVLARDTAPEVERIQIDIWRSMSPLQKSELTGAMTRSARDLAMVGLRSRHPDASAEELRLRIAQITLGDELTRRVYPEASEFLGP